jgi:short subunit dehydrogenase-like uncharacterized protein
MPTTSQYDIIVFGATSFVGQIITRYLFTQYGLNNTVKWAIAGRSATKLSAVRDALGPDAHNLPMIVANAQSAGELRQLCLQTQVVLSTVGPYALYGEPLVKACAETGTDYCDLTGEVHWVKQMIARYEPLAKQTGARIVPCCGYDSIPSDMGVYFLQQQAQQRFGRYCLSATMRVKAAKGGVSGGTMASMVNLLKEAAADPELRAELTDYYSICPPVSYTRPRQKPVMSVAYDADARGWIAPFVMAGVNERVVQRSNAFLHYHEQFTYNEAMLTGAGLPGFATAATVTGGVGLFMGLMLVGPFRRLIQRVLPQPGEGPSPEAQRTGFFVHEVYGHTEAGQRLLITVSGDRDPGYGSTAKMIAEAALSLAQDVAKTDKPGGFYTPASLFGERLIDRLQQSAGITFAVVK